MVIRWQNPYYHPILSMQILTEIPLSITYYPPSTKKTLNSVLRFIKSYCFSVPYFYFPVLASHCSSYNYVP